MMGLYFLAFCAFNIHLVVALHEHDFSTVYRDIEFIYHDNHNLLLGVKDNSCYIANVEGDLAESIMRDHSQWALDEMAHQILDGDDAHRLFTHNDDYLREVHHDLLADYHCFGKALKEVTIHWPEFKNEASTASP